MSYCVDSSVWIDAVRDYNPASKLFDDFWTFVEKKVNSGLVIAPDEVHVELKLKTIPDSLEFGKLMIRCQAKLFFKPASTPGLQSRFSKMVKKYPELTTKGKPFAKSDGDAWVVALALIEGATVVTHEAPRPSAPKRRTIPDVCDAEGVEWIRLPTLLNRLQGLK